ncbi:MAG: hypothetical protein Q9211_000063 [Gyalolechia sp. 1 TL-2023]
MPSTLFNVSAFNSHTFLNDYIPYKTDSNNDRYHSSSDDFTVNKGTLQAPSSKPYFSAAESISQYPAAREDGQTEGDRESNNQHNLITKGDLSRMGQRMTFLIRRMEERLTTVTEQAKLQIQRTPVDNRGYHLGTLEDLDRIERRLTSVIERATQKIALSGPLASTRTPVPPVFETSCYNESTSDHGEGSCKDQTTAALVVDWLRTTFPGEVIRAENPAVETHDNAAKDEDDTSNDGAKPDIATAAPPKGTLATADDTRISSSLIIRPPYYKYFGAYNRL